MQSVEHEAPEELNVQEDNCKTVELVGNPEVGKGHFKEWGQEDSTLGRGEGGGVRGKEDVGGEGEVGRWAGEEG